MQLFSLILVGAERSQNVSFAPVADITAYELAQIVQLLAMAFEHPDQVYALYDGLSADVTRHFVIG